MAVNLINNEQIHVNQDGSNITLDIQEEALKNKNAVVGSIRSKNMFNKKQIYLFKGYIDGSGKLISNADNYCLILPFEKVGTFTFSFSIISNRIRIAEYNSLAATNDTQLSLLGESEANASTLTFTTTSNCKYLYIAIGNTTAITNINTALNSIQIEIGNTPSPYIPYQSIDNGVFFKNVGFNQTVSAGQVIFTLTDLELDTLVSFSFHSTKNNFGGYLLIAMGYDAILIGSRNHNASGYNLNMSGNKNSGIVLTITENNIPANDIFEVKVFRTANYREQ